jgi:hypothetical protein
MKRKTSKNIIFTIGLLLFSSLLIGIVVGLVTKTISIKSILIFVGNFWLIWSCFASLILSGFQIFSLDRTFLRNYDDEAKMFFWTIPLSYSWLFIKVIIPFIFMYDIKPWIPLEKFHFVDSTIIQILASNSGTIIHFSIYFLSAIPLIMLLAFCLDYFKEIKQIKKPEIENPQIAKTNFARFVENENLTVMLVLFQFFYIGANFTYPTLVFFLNS